MKKVRQISQPHLSSAKILTPLEMNGIAIQRNHTLLTPENLSQRNDTTTGNQE